MLARYLEEAPAIIQAAAAAPPHGPDIDPTLSPEFERIRWFPLPGEARAELLGAGRGRSRSPRHAADPRGAFAS